MTFVHEGEKQSLERLVNSSTTYMELGFPIDGYLTGYGAGGHEAGTRSSAQGTYTKRTVVAHVPTPTKHGASLSCNAKDKDKKLSADTS